MQSPVKKIFIIIAVTIVIVGLYFGAYLPYKKAKTFISKVRLLQSVGSVEELRYHLDEVLDINSPVGREEIASFVVNNLMGVIRVDLPEEIGRLIIDYVEEVAHPVLTNQQSPELTRMIFRMGVIYQRAWLLYEDRSYAYKAEEMYLKGLNISPDRPQFLYGLFNLYLSEGETEKAVRVGEKIAIIWPTDFLLKQKLQLPGYTFE